LTLFAKNNVRSVSHVLLLRLHAQDDLELEGDFGSSLRWVLWQLPLFLQFPIGLQKNGPLAATPSSRALHDIDPRRGPLYRESIFVLL
jgi:hypothetical protein